MKRVVVSFMSAVVACSLVIVGCSQATPPAPTQAPAAPTKAAVAAPTKAAEPTKAPTTQPTPVPTKAVDYPAKGSSITLIVPWAAGGPVDVASRLLAPALEKELGVPIQIVNKGGASSQIGVTDLVRAKPDGYTILAANQPATVTTYLDPEMKAIYSRKDLQPVAMFQMQPYAVAVNASSQYKTVKDLVDAAKAAPERIKFATAGVTSLTHYAVIKLGDAAGVKFASVHFDGGGPATTALAGGHVDASIQGTGAYTTYVQSGTVRLVGLMNKEESKFAAGVKTLEAQGYKLYIGASTGIVVPAGTPKEIVRILSGAVKKVVGNEQVARKMEEMNYDPRYMDTAEYEADWSEAEAQARELVSLARR